MWSKLAFTAFAAAVLASCSGGGGSSAPVDVTPVSGFVSKGPINGATCNVFNSANQLVLTATTVNGAVAFGSLTAGAYTASCTGGTYKDEATGLTVANTTVLRSGVVVGTGGAAVMTVSPLTDLVYQRAGGDATKMEAAAQTVAKAFGLPASVNLLTTVPTDVNTTAAANDAAGQYGTLLAAIAQMQKDQGQSLGNIISTLGAGINATGASPTLNAAVANQLSTAVSNLTDPSKNSNPTVQGAVGATKTVLQTNVAALADTTPFANSIVLSSTPSGTEVTAPLFGQSYSLRVVGGNLGAASLAAVNMTCSAVSASATAITATCVMAAFGTQASVAVQVGGANVQGLTPSVQWFLGNSGQSCKLGAIVTAVSPTTFAYGAQSVAVTVQGCSLSGGATLAMDGQSCALSAGGTSSQLQFRCNVPNTRNGGNTGNLALASYGAAGTSTTAIAYTVPAVAVASASPASLVQGSAGNANWTVNGSGLFTGMAVSLGGTPCSAAGTANASGTQLTGVNCGNVPVSASASSTALSVGGVSLSVALTAPPVPTIGVSGATTIQQGGSTQLTPSSASGGAFSYSMATGGSNASVDSSGKVTGLAVGSASVLVSQAAVAGQFAAASTTVNINVSAQTVPVISFAESAKTVKLGDADFSNAATVTCATGGAGYNPAISYSATGGASLVSLSGSTVALKGAGSATIQASVPAVGTCAAQAVSYALTINKASPQLSMALSTTSTSFSQTGITALATVAAPANQGSGGALPSTSSLLLTYASNNTAVATVDSSGNVSIVGVGVAAISASTASDANYLVGSSTGVSLTIGKASVTPTFALPAGLTLSTSSTTPVGNTTTLVGPQGPAAPSGAITYISANTGIATVDASGRVTPVAVGSTTITANYPGDANYNAASANYPVVVSAFTLGETPGPAPDGMSFVYTGLPGADLSALSNFDFDGGAKTLYWQPSLASGGIPDNSLGVNALVLRNVGYDDRIIIRVASGAIPEPETGGTYPQQPSPYPVSPTNPAGSTVNVSGAGVVAAHVVTSIPQNTYRGYDYSRWVQRYFTGLTGTPGGANDLLAQYPFDQYTYYNDRAGAGGGWGVFEIVTGWLVPGQIDNGDGTFTTYYTGTQRSITLSGFPTYYNPIVSSYPYTYKVRYYNATNTGTCDPNFTNNALNGWWCPFAAGDGSDPFGGERPGYSASGNFITFRP